MYLFHIHTHKKMYTDKYNGYCILVTINHLKAYILYSLT